MWHIACACACVHSIATRCYMTTLSIARLLTKLYASMQSEETAPFDILALVLAPLDHVDAKENITPTSNLQYQLGEPSNTRKSSMPVFNFNISFSNLAAKDE